MNKVEKAIRQIEMNVAGPDYFDIEFEADLINALNDLKAQDTITDYSVEVEPESFEITFSLKGE